MRSMRWPESAMPDWKKIVSKHLGLKHIHEEAVCELAAHLEESYENHRSRGLTEANALAETLQELENCDVLAKAIRRRNSEEGLMNYRTRWLWLPGMIMMLLASLSLMVFVVTGFRETLIWRAGPIVLWFYGPWLASLMIVGAAGGFLSKRERASIRTRLAVVAPPALLIAICMCIFSDLSALISHLNMILNRFWWFYLTIAVANWLVVPGSALLLGAAPFLWAPQRQA
jgi:hypothetical protein